MGGLHFCVCGRLAIFLSPLEMGGGSPGPRADPAVEPGRPIRNPLFRRSPDGLRLSPGSDPLFPPGPGQRLRGPDHPPSPLGLDRILVFRAVGRFLPEGFVPGELGLWFFTPCRLFLLDAGGLDDDQLAALGFRGGGKSLPEGKGRLVLPFLRLGHAIIGGLSGAGLFDGFGDGASFRVENQEPISPRGHQGPQERHEFPGTFRSS